MQRALTELERAGLIETLDARMARVAEQESRWLRGDDTPPRVEPREVEQPTPAEIKVEKRKAAADAKRLERALGSGSRATIFDRVRVFFGTLGYEATSGGGKAGAKIRRVLLILTALAVIGGIGASIVALGWQASTLRQRVERDAAAWLGEPVRVGNVGVGFRPWPVFELSDIQIGEGGVSQISRAWSGPDWFHWMTSQPQRLSVSMRGATVHPSLLMRLAGLESPGRVWRLKEIQLEDLAVPIGVVRVEGLTGSMAFAGDGKWESARLKNAEGTVTYEMSAQDGGVSANVIAPEFAYGDTKVQNFLLSGKLGLTSLVGGQFGANWLGGALKGSLDLDLSKSVSLKGQVKLDAVGFEPLAALLKGAGVVQGRLSGSAALSGEADSIAALAKGLRWAGSYSVADGAINRLDLLEAMRRQGNAPISGGVTRFGLMEGGFVYEPAKGAKLEIRRLDAGALSATGRLQVDAEGNAKGALRSEVRTPVERIARSFAVEGALQTLQLRPLGD
ncbi:hypothetical protein OPU71_03170 [Niveibacterium sp. 24ML]|uniref:hypothetical protein n=1 Tax=Niveibacterium sp. 24ML TaxID=2985512 RepID=UPI002270E99B|nr:hypothetical protein [Niveibacterium sp. 24ML]MCX9155118.1 hypothetical protein [Niveibacterium sp. 24ML]